VEMVGIRPLALHLKALVEVLGVLIWIDRFLVQSMVLPYGLTVHHGGVMIGRVG
jgi:hypothetical protein